MGPTKRLIILGATIAMLSHLFSFNTQVSANEETYFVATAYYSPLPGQSRYTTGSYEGDVRLNGEGVTTASGGGVFPGLLAGPKNYPFGTKIYFEGYGIGEIADRGGAIVKAGERGHSYDRIDIWMGYGDEGLERALRWGKRTIKGKIVVPSSQVTLSLPESPLGVLRSLHVNPESSKGEDVKELQIIFTKADLYSGEIDGSYESIKNELIDFQLKSGIISSRNDEAAGWYGKKTIAALREKYGSDTSILVEEPIELFSQYNHKRASEKYKIILEYGALEVSPESDSETVKELQKLMKELGEYTGEIDGNYTNISKPLIDLQIKIGLIRSEKDWGAGYFGNRTKTALWSYYEMENDVFLEESLSLTEQTRMKNAFNVVVKKLEQEEKRGGTPAKQRLSNLKKQIETILPTIKEKELQLKLKFLQELI